MNIKITGDIRDVANSAWVSTLDETRAASKSEAEVDRVVSFLAQNSHTSPFECVTITLDLNGTPNRAFYEYAGHPNARWSETLQDFLTIDLLNFYKVTFTKQLFDQEPWQLFEQERPRLSEAMKQFKMPEDSPAPDPSEDLGKTTMSVELVSLHKTDSLTHSRATWRVKCSLSIAVQILRHRKLSANMVSGRYRTITQEQTLIPTDCADIAVKSDLSDELTEMFELSEDVMDRYQIFMKSLKASKESGKINNDEYKRMREFARFVLPEGRMTELYVTFYLEDFYNNYKRLRDSVHAQKEHIYIAQQMAKTLESE